MGDRAMPKSVFVIFESAGSDGSVAVLLSEQDMPSEQRVGAAKTWQPALDALGGKREAIEHYATTACREVDEETGKLVGVERLQSLRAWIAAQPLQDSANVYYDQEGAALFFFCPIPREGVDWDFWRTLNETFDSEFGETPPDRTRSPSHLHWLKLVAPWKTAHDGMPVAAPLHRCVPGCAARCGRTECAVKTLGLKPHVERALQHRRDMLRQQAGLTPAACRELQRRACVQSPQLPPPAPLPPPPQRPQSRLGPQLQPLQLPSQWQTARLPR